MSYKRQLTNYIYEQSLVRKLNNDKWTARRLSEASGTNCVVAINNRESTLLAISVHLGTNNNVVVLQNQISYCLKIRDLFGCYKTRHAILVFRFPAKSKGKYISDDEKRPVEYYKIVDKLLGFYGIPAIRCTIGGITSVMQNGKWLKKSFPNYVMPFQIAWY